MKICNKYTQTHREKRRMERSWRQAGQTSKKASGGRRPTMSKRSRNDSSQFVGPMRNAAQTLTIQSARFVLFQFHVQFAAGEFFSLEKYSGALFSRTGFPSRPWSYWAGWTTLPNRRNLPISGWLNQIKIVNQLNGKEAILVNLWKKQLVVLYRVCTLLNSAAKLYLLDQWTFPLSMANDLAARVHFNVHDYLPCQTIFRWLQFLSAPDCKFYWSIAHSISGKNQ